MEKYSDYIILHAANVADLSEEVKQYLRDGWVVLGAPFSHVGQGGTEICQGLIKPDTIRPGSIGFNR
jgi:hypothetical protein